MKVTLYTREECAECLRVWEMLSEAAARLGFDLHEAASPEGAPAPCMGFDAPGAPFYRAEGLTEAQFAAYFDEATWSLGDCEKPVGSKLPRPAKRAGTGPDAAYEKSHPVRSFIWRHRVGAIISALSIFLGTAWLAPLTPSWGWGNSLYSAVHSAYRLVCDQVPERSAQLGGLPVCLCWRCTAIYAGSLFFGIMYAVGRDRQIDWLGWLRRPASLAAMLLFGLPLILDGATHALGLRAGISYAHSPDFWLSWQTFSVDWWLRIATALIATVGAVKFICPRLDKIGFVYERLYRDRVGAAPQSSAGALSAQVPPSPK